jgi:ParB family transcriptional regulator, chromosome partitioning protein
MTTIQDVLISSICVLNPRSRNKNLFAGIVANIDTLGLKKPITITPKIPPVGEKCFDLVCGQGRLEAYHALGHESIPAIVIETTKEEAYLMSLVENIARRHHTPMELVKEVSRLKGGQLTTDQIAAKLGLDRNYVYTIIHLLENGEHHLIKEVERGRIPVSVAIKISTAADHDVQTALRQAYSRGELRAQQLVATKRFLAQRTGTPQPTARKRFTSQSAVRAYKQFTVEHHALISRARHTEERLLLIVTAFKRLVADEHFVTLLRAEHLETMPRFLAERIKKGS